MNILVTGASSGIGRALVVQLVTAGHEVIGIARREQELNALQRELHSPKFITRACDVANQEKVEQFIHDLAARQWLPDTAVLGAGIFPDDIHPAFNLEQFRTIVEINLYGVLNFINALLPYYVQLHKGHFIALGSMAMYRGSMRGAGYPASKAALLTAMKSLALRYRSEHIQFSTIIFGPIATAMWEGKKSFLTPTPTHAARYIVTRIKAPKELSYFPLLSTTLYRMSLMIPDGLFVSLSEKLLK
ncbi:MAG: SDR family oxidoreductase [Patescibacteria group bacterium]